MVQSKNYELVKRHYEEGTWTIDYVWKVVGKAAGITEAEYNQITVLKYPNKK